jgi:hypothetical protein
VNLSFNFLDVSTPAECDNCLSGRADIGIDTLVSLCFILYDLLSLGWLLA